MSAPTLARRGKDPCEARQPLKDVVKTLAKDAFPPSLCKESSGADRGFWVRKAYKIFIVFLTNKDNLALY